MNNNLLWRMLKGQVINNQYHLKDLIGAGGYGGVFLADEVIRDKLIRQVAIKLIISDNHNDGQLNEIIAATDLQHPNLIRCFYGGESQLNGAAFLYLVMEVADFSLEKRLTQGVLSETEATLLVQDIAEALVYLHNQPKAVTHRDLKPGNVLRVGDKWRLSDFGLVKIIGAGSVSNTSKVFGTAQYVPPEAYDGEISPAWDVWSLGIIIVEALTGKPPFQGETEQQLQKQICEKDPDLSGLPQKFERIARGCLEKDRQKRWNAKQVLDVFSEKRKLPEDAVVYYNQGILYYKLNENKKALDDFNQALKLDPNYAAAYSSRGNVYGRLKENQKALDDFNQALKLDPNYAAAYSGRGKVYCRLKENQKALDDCNQALKLDPNDAAAYIGRGAVYNLLGENQKALDDCNQALKIDPNDAYAYQCRGAVYNLLGENQKALDDCNQALKLDVDPDDAAAYIGRGAVYNLLGKRQKALDDFNQALKLDPNDAAAYIGRGSVYIRLGEGQKALDDCNQALKLDPNNAYAYALRGRAYYELGVKQKTLDDYEKAAQLFREDGQTGFYKGIMNEINLISRKTPWDWFRSGVESLWNDLSSLL